MNMFLPGEVSKLDTIDIGSCILFNMPDGLHLGMVLGDGNYGRTILDFEGKNRREASQFMIYQGGHFLNEAILRLTGSRFRADLASNSLGHGLHESGNESKALYLTPDGAIVHAALDHQLYKINLKTGGIVQTELTYVLHAKRWRVEVEDGTGRFEVLREISA